MLSFSWSFALQNDLIRSTAGEGVALVHYGLLAQRSPHSTRLEPGHLPPRGRLLVVPFIIRKYNITSLYGVARAFPEGEGGREADE